MWSSLGVFRRGPFNSERSGHAVYSIAKSEPEEEKLVYFKKMTN